MTAAVEPIRPAGEVTPETTAAEQFRRVVASQPDDVALTTATSSFTYAEIDRWSDAIAADIIACEAPADRPVALVARDNILPAPRALGGVKAGHYFVTGDASDPDDRVSLILRESAAALCLVDSLDDVPGPVREHRFIEVRRFPVESVTPPERPPNQWIQVSFTSGTTGAPKAILTPHRGFVEKTLRRAGEMGRGRGERCTWTAVPGYTRAAGGMLNSLLGGATLCAFDARSEGLDRFADYVARERITRLGMTPAFFRRFMAAAPPDLDLSSVRTLSLIADKITVTDVETYKARFPRTCTLRCGYASTEAGGVFSMSYTHDTPVTGPAVPMGKKNPGIDVWLLDEEGNEVPDGEAGEIVVRGRSVIAGYWNDPELTAQKFRTDPDDPSIRTFYTGDLARRSPDGYYYFVGRSDSRLKIYGRRIDPSEVEAALIGTGEIREAVVVGKSDPNGDLRLVAYVVMREGKACAPKAIRAKLRETQPAWLVPARIFEIDSVPLTSALKVDRKSLIARVDPVDSDDGGARDDLERRLVEAWSRVVGTAVHVDDDFFDDLGGESVVAAHLVTEVQRVAGVPIPMSLLLELNTVSRMAEYLRGANVAERLAVLVQAGGPLPPVFCVTGKDGSVIKFRTLAATIGKARPFYGLTFHGFDLDAFPSSASTIAACYAQAIRKIQAAGPYYVSGYSGGARTALEIARLLERQGETVVFVGMLDAAGAPQRASIWRRIVNRVDMLRQLPEGRLRHFLREAATRPASIFKRFVRRRLVERGLAFPPPVRAANRAHMAAQKDYSSQPYGGVVSLFCARNGQGLLGTEPDRGWSKAGVTRLERFDVLGDHNTMLTSQVESLASAFRTALESADARAAGLAVSRTQ